MSLQARDRIIKNSNKRICEYQYILVFERLTKSLGNLNLVISFFFSDSILFLMDTNSSNQKM
jgi:hypothetical protein